MSQLCVASYRIVTYVLDGNSDIVTVPRDQVEAVVYHIVPANWLRHHCPLYA